METQDSIDLDAPEDVDHTVTGYMVDYFVCFVLLLTGFAILMRHGKKGLLEAIVQFLMSNGYLMGSLGHHMFANRAQTDGCANVYYYVCWAISYPSMSGSNLLWLMLGFSENPNKRSKRGVQLRNSVFWIIVFHLFSDALIVAGGAWCFFSVPHYSGFLDDCEPGGPGTAPTCDGMVWWGEALYFAAWFASSVAAANAAYDTKCAANEYWFNIIQVVLLIFGPVQILFVYDLLPNGGAELSAQLGTAVTYKLAVCANQLTIVLLSHLRLVKKESKNQKTK